MTTGRKGPARGTPRTRAISYDPSSGDPWRTGVVLLPDEAAKAITAAKLAGLSVAGLLGELIKRLEVDEEGRPTWAPKSEEQHQQDPLPVS